MMPDAPAIADRSRDYAFALAAQFPGLTSEDLSVCEEPDADLIRVDWDGWTALFPQSEAAVGQLRVMASVMPHLRGFVTPAIPIWERGDESDDWKRAWRAAAQPEGRPLRPELIVEQNRERLVRDLASFFHELHQFSVERARGLGAASFHSWRDEHADLSRRSQAVLRPLLSWSDMTWARKWWARLLDDDSVWTIMPSLVHGGISIERLLVAPLVDAYGTELGWRIVEHYGELGSTADAALFRRIRLQQTVKRFRDVVEAFDRGGVESEAMSAALNRLR